MQFITSLFGGSENSWLTAVFALGIVLVLIVLGVWLLKLVFNASSNVARGRNRRLAVVDTLALDPKRQLLIVRRDNVEHLILTGGPQDLVVETGIAIEEAPAAQPARRPIPTVARKPVQTAPRPAAAAPAAPAVVVRPEPVAAHPTAADKLREMGHPTDRKAHLSLRHTGLLRPINEAEPALSPENSGSPAATAPDSAKEDGAQRQVEGTGFVEDTNEAKRN